MTHEAVIHASNQSYHCGMSENVSPGYTIVIRARNLQLHFEAISLCEYSVCSVCLRFVAAVDEFGKLIKIWRSYRHELVVLLSGTRYRLYASYKHQKTSAFLAHTLYDLITEQTQLTRSIIFINKLSIAKFPTLFLATVLDHSSCFHVFLTEFRP